MWKSLVLGLGLLLCAAPVADVCEAQLDASVGYAKMIVIPSDIENSTVQFDNIAASLSWTIGHLWVFTTIGEDVYGALGVGYGHTGGDVRYAVCPVFRWFDKGALGIDDDAFSIGVQAKVGFDTPSGNGSVIPTELVFGWSRSIREVCFLDALTDRDDFHTVSFEIITNFPIRR